MNSAVVASIVGVAFGAAGAVLAQYLVVRADKRRDDRRRWDDRLTYRRQLVREFMEECQRAEAMAVHHFQKDQWPEGASLDHLWYLQKYLNLIIPEIEEPTKAYAWRLDRLVWAGLSQVNDQTGQTYPDVWEAMRAPRNKFLGSAREFVR